MEEMAVCLQQLVAGWIVGERTLSALSKGIPRLTAVWWPRLLPPAALKWWHAGLQTVSTQHQGFPSLAAALGLPRAKLPVAWKGPFLSGIPPGALKRMSQQWTVYLCPKRGQVGNR